MTVTEKFCRVGDAINLKADLAKEGWALPGELDLAPNQSYYGCASIALVEEDKDGCCSTLLNIFVELEHYDVFLLFSEEFVKIVNKQKGISLKIHGKGRNC